MSKRRGELVGLFRRKRASSSSVPWIQQGLAKDMGLLLDAVGVRAKERDEVVRAIKAIDGTTQFGNLTPEAARRAVEKANG